MVAAVFRTIFTQPTAEAVLATFSFYLSLAGQEVRKSSVIAVMLGPEQRFLSTSRFHFLLSNGFLSQFVSTMTSNVPESVASRR